MLKKVKKMILFSAIISLFIACTKDMEPVLPTEPDPVETPIPDPEEEPTPPTEEESVNSIEVGTGSGDLIIDGNNAAIKGKNLILIKGGTYGSISIKNVNGAVDAPVFIKNGGQVNIRGAMYTENINNVTIAGDNDPGIEYGFNFHDISYRAFVLKGKMNGVTLKSLSFKNVSDYVILAETASINYQGSAETRTERFKILNCRFDNVASIQLSGHFGTNEDNGLIKDLEIAHNTFVNSNAGVLVFVGNVQNYNIHHNVANNINPTNNNHNGIFQMIGNGKFHNNKFTNFQGNMIRAWVFSRGTTPSTVEFYNNTAYNTRKYGAFEIQGFDNYIIPGKTTFVNAKVYNNTVGKMNTSKEWEGVVLDLYNYRGTLEYYNNLGFDLYQTRSITDMINNMSDTKIIKNENNKYFGSASEAVSNVTDFKSKHPGIGSTL